VRRRADAEEAVCSPWAMGVGTRSRCRERAALAQTCDGMAPVSGRAHAGVDDLDRLVARRAANTSR